ncbi:hypothetical protein HPP92_019623 [Vanilla planifolia]|uniref:Late embryogenesis abundant protein LEA-2 subgroup domain-containing protein n=1 Tax=Vanilla planifolia TaxID=51239 RepID=A0A835UHR0_VANPL|nr:hypothetical protein HPP92_019623 [Vanilla planifolia]
MGATQDTTSEQSQTLLPPPQTSPIYGFPVALPPPPDDHPPAYVLLPVYPLVRRRRRLRCCYLPCHPVLSASSYLVALASFLFLLACSLFLVWPSNPEISVVGIRLDRFRIAPLPLSSIDIAMGLNIKIRNPDLFSIDYSSIHSSLFYRGEDLGSVTTLGGRIAARRVSYVDADLHLDGVRLLGDLFYLIGDVAKGSVPFDSVTEIKGRLRIFFFDVPIKGKISCVVHVKPEDQSIRYEDCRPVEWALTLSLEILEIVMSDREIGRMQPQSSKDGKLFGYNEEQCNSLVAIATWEHMEDGPKLSGAMRGVLDLPMTGAILWSVVITFGLNALYGRMKASDGLYIGDWDSSNTREFINYTITRKYKIDSWEFGNELSGRGIGARVDADQFGKDLVTLKADVTMLLINLSNSTTFNVSVKNNMNLYPPKMKEFPVSTILKQGEREVYHLTPADGKLQSRVVLLNGKPLQLTSSKDIPNIDPMTNSSEPAEFVQLSPLSIAFVRFKGFRASACP